MSSRRAGPVPSHRGEVDDHGDVLVAAAGVAPHVVVHADHGDPVKALLVVNQHTLVFGQDGVVGGVPGDAEPVGDAGHGEVLDHDPFQGPSQSGAGQHRPRLCSAADIPRHTCTQPLHL